MVALLQSTSAKINLRQIKASQRLRPNVRLDREQASHTSSARAGRSRQSQSKWAGPRVVRTRTALVTAPFLVCHLRCAVSLPKLHIAPTDRHSQESNAFSDALLCGELIGSFCLLVRWARPRPQPFANGLEHHVKRRDREDADK